MFLAGRSPALTLAGSELAPLLVALDSAGYREHTGPRISRRGELVAYVRPLDHGKRQIHVQVIQCPCGKLELFAHTEPWGWGLRHLWAALTDRVSYQHGARILREDLGVERAAERAA